ncbi:MAG TPA: DNA/RNA nuclease SfsA [Candidatus Lachnoclostridium stercoripullorum]|uniref:Sugar fermentation stimulation protein homolog n=1 Tax=Candidatus Lachnoclostridium stercoripullorum TaxID=2838635 RepID=A0A9D1W3G1_9FIRM|nr:DNA/RNA nuclease SfsA [Candidatus Lachnoclostridium stercoripullorum]
MTYENIEPGIFLARPNRFTARVLIRGRETVCHVKNTGRCRELLLPGASVLVQFHPDAKAAGRKTEYSLIAVWKSGVLINMDSQAPNQAAWEWLRTSPQLADLRREVTFGNSRFDLAFTRGGNPGFMEVKGVTLEENGTARFPDAPTLRGVRHIRELTRMAGEGMDAAVLFVIQMKGVSSFEPNMATQPEFGLALRDAADAGVQILARDCLVSLDEAAGTLSLAIDAPVPVKLP